MTWGWKCSSGKYARDQGNRLHMGSLKENLCLVFLETRYPLRSVLINTSARLFILCLVKTELLRPRVKAHLSRDTPKVKGLHFFARGIGFYDESNKLCVHDTGPQGSNLYSSMVKANCIMHLEEEWEEASAGTEVNIEWITW